MPTGPLQITGLKCPLHGTLLWVSLSARKVNNLRGQCQGKQRVIHTAGTSLRGSWRGSENPVWGPGNFRKNHGKTYCPIKYSVRGKVQKSPNIPCTWNFVHANLPTGEDNQQGRRKSYPHYINLWITFPSLAGLSPELIILEWFRGCVSLLVTQWRSRAINTGKGPGFFHGEP
jgi:hypothetical protein